MTDSNYLNLTNCGINLNYLKNYFNIYSNNKSKITNIISLRLSFNNICDDGIILISNYITNNSILTILDLGFNQISDRGVEALCYSLTKNQTLKVLYLSGNCITNIGCSYLALLLQDNHVLTQLNLAGNPLTNQGAQELSNALLSNSTLSILDLNSTNIRKNGFSFLGEIFRNEFLNIRELFLGNNDCEDEGIQQLANSLIYYRKLQTLDLSFNRMSEKSFEILGNSLNNYSTLSILSLSNNQLGDRSIKFLIKLIQNLNSLQQLIIDYNGISPMGILAIINSISLLSCFHKPFTKLSLSGNSMNTDSAKALGALLNHQNGSSIRQLHLDHMNIGKQGEQQIAVSIASNQHCNLETITGLALGPLMTEIGSPPQLADFNNTQVLKYVREMWSTYNQNNENNNHNDNNSNNINNNGHMNGNGNINGHFHSNDNDCQITETNNIVNDCHQTKNDLDVHNNDCNYQLNKISQSDNQHNDIESVLRKRAASIGNEAENNNNNNNYDSCNSNNNQTNSLNNTQSEDDLTDLADDVQTHIRSSGPSQLHLQLQQQNQYQQQQQQQQPITTIKLKANTLAETAEENSTGAEQFKLLLKKLELIFDPILTEVANLSFDPSNLWTLHQYYFSPSTHVANINDLNNSNESMEIEIRKHKNSSYDTHDEDDSYDDLSRPSKRPSNRLTMTRIAAYPRIKKRLEILKSTSEERMLTILRQLRCIEEYIDRYKDSYPYFIEMDVESIILDRNGY